MPRFCVFTNYSSTEKKVYAFPELAYIPKRVDSAFCQNCWVLAPNFRVLQLQIILRFLEASSDLTVLRWEVLSHVTLNSGRAKQEDEAEEKLINRC